MPNNETTIDEAISDVTAMDATTISVRELKAHASKLLKLLEGDTASEIIITSHGKPCGRLVSLAQFSPPTSTAPPVERRSLRNTMSHLANTGEKDLVEATNIWGPVSNV